jgi:hypothetical protein
MPAAPGCEGSTGGATVVFGGNKLLGSLDPGDTVGVAEALDDKADETDEANEAADEASDDKEAAEEDRAPGSGVEAGGTTVAGVVVSGASGAGAGFGAPPPAAGTSFITSGLAW